MCVNFVLLSCGLILSCVLTGNWSTYLVLKCCDFSVSSPLSNCPCTHNFTIFTAFLCDSANNNQKLVTMVSVLFLLILTRLLYVSV